MKIKICNIGGFLILWSMSVLIFSQTPPLLVTYTNSYDATALNNSHKMATSSTMPYDQYVVIAYRSADTIFTVRSVNGGASWQPKIAVDIGDCWYPAIDLDRYNNRHLAWQKLVSAGYDIIYDCLDDTLPPVNVSNSFMWSSVWPDLVVDTNLTVHITWTERVNPLVDDRVYYRSYFNGSLQDTVQLSVSRHDFGSSISIFNPNNRLYAVWWRAVSGRYAICMRYRESGWSGLDSLASGSRALRYPSLDYSHASDVFSAGFEDSTSGNLDVRFYGGNGGWGNTAGRSQFPVLSTVGTMYSYIFWMEDSNDIYYQTYYGMSGWSGIRSLRATFSITEPVRYPSACGSSVIWTQGYSAPYKIYFASFGYPIGADERAGTDAPICGLCASPDPAQGPVNIAFNLSASAELGMSLSNAAGRIVKRVRKKNYAAGYHKEQLDISDQPNGVYFYRLDANETIPLIKKIVLLK